MESENPYFRAMVFTTGATGLLGSHLLLELLRRGERVRALARPGSDLGKVRELFRWYGPEAEAGWDRIDWVMGDLLDIPFLETALGGVEKVYHCGAMISFDPADKETLLKVNWEGTRNLVDLCLALGVPVFCHVSSIATLGGLGAVRTESDTSEPASSSGYAISKYLAEMEVWRGNQEGLRTVIVNPGVILGPGPWTRGSSRFFSETASGLRFCPPGATGFVGVRDVARAMLELTEASCFGDRFILVSENLAYQDLIGHIAGQLQVPAPRKTLRAWQLEALWRLDWLRRALGGKRRRLSKASARSLKRSRIYSNEKIRQRLGFEFEPIEAVVREVAAYYRNRHPNPGKP